MESHLRTVPEGNTNRALSSSPGKITGTTHSHRGSFQPSLNPRECPDGILEVPKSPDTVCTIVFVTGMCIVGARGCAFF